MKSLLQHAQVTTDDGLILNGFYARGNRDKPTCILIHGFTGDPYSHKMYSEIADALVAKGIGVLLAHHRGTGIQTEILKADGTAVYLGSYYERIEDAHFDITAWIEWLAETENNDRVVLLGHSLGCLKALRYMHEGQRSAQVEKLILLAPFAKGAFIEQKSPGQWREHLEMAMEMMAESKGNELVTADYEDYAMSFRTFVSWYEENDLNSMFDFHRSDYDFPGLQSIEIPTLVQLGDADEFSDYPDQGVSSSQVLRVFEKFVPDSYTVLIAGAGHTFDGYESEVAATTGSFLSAD